MPQQTEIEYGPLPGSNSAERPSYRVVLFDRNGRVHSITPLLVTEDASAKMSACRMANGLSAELWDGLRYIDRYDGTE
ncbi:MULTISPECIES: hypothetical protein [Methylobacterium]|uniref:Uncharacterized protein n=1 Tax=Methylobacterium thuringiense TaxID=1003091 RepID=A0ABQ4TJP3_9HYPH|nr:MULTISPECIES: hypothetical protein [Methylobacterium]TXN21781.1 hypothetical protein FV217_13305 [Methylobacterium sp. WL9]GJE54813.1 hypothetical protein EKPJFOCH_1298 [Methylobacterium thuringiense]